MSVQSDWEHQEMNRIRKPKNTLWLGGTTQDEADWNVCGGACRGTPGSWRWSDGSPWDFRGWESNSECPAQSDTFGASDQPCLSSPDRCDHLWRVSQCQTPVGHEKAGMCQKTPQKLSGTTKQRFEYTKADFKDNQHLAFHVWHKYEAARKQILDSWQDPRMTGFRLRYVINNQAPKN